MNPRSRLGQLLEQAKAMHRGQRLADRRMVCRGKTWEEVLALVEAAIDPADVDVAEKIMALVEERAHTPVNDYANGHTKDPKGEAAWPPVRDADGNIVYETHHFIWWLLGLQRGSWSLPERIPRAALGAFAERYGGVGNRCEDCLMGLANAARFDCCPVCGSTRISCKDLSGRHYEYRPIPYTVSGARSPRSVKTVE